MGSVWLALARRVAAAAGAPWLGLALLLGVIGGVVLTAAAGARRTDTAYPRLLQWANASQVAVAPLGTGPVPDGTGTTGYYAALSRLPRGSVGVPPGPCSAWRSRCGAGRRISA